MFLGICATTGDVTSVLFTPADWMAVSQSVRFSSGRKLMSRTGVGRSRGWNSLSTDLRQADVSDSRVGQSLVTFLLGECDRSAV